MLGILLIPHNNAECGHTFSEVKKKKHRTEFCSSLSDEKLECLLLMKNNSLVTAMIKTLIKNSYQKLNQLLMFKIKLCKYAKL